MSMKKNTVVIIVALQLLGIALYPINASNTAQIRTNNTAHQENQTHSHESDVLHDNSSGTHIISSIQEDTPMTEEKTLVADNPHNNSLDKEVTKDLQTAATTFGVEITTDHDVTTHPVLESSSSFFPTANSYEGSYYLLSRARRLVEGDPTVSTRTPLTKITMSDTAIFARQRRVGQWIGGGDIFTESDFFAQKDKRYDNWAAEMAKKKKIKEIEMRRQRDETEADGGEDSSNSPSFDLLLSLTLSMDDTTKQAKLRRTFLSNKKHTIESKISRLAVDIRSFEERIYDTFMNHPTQLTRGKRTKEGQRSRNNREGMTRQYVGELRDTLLKYYSEDPYVVSRYLDNSNMAFSSSGPSNEEYADSPLEHQAAAPLFGMLSLTPKYENTINETVKSLITPSSYYSPIFNRTTSWFMSPSSRYPSILSVPFFDFVEMKLLWHEYHSLKNDEIWLRKNCFGGSVSRCRTDDVTLRSNILLQDRKDSKKDSTRDKSNKDSAESDYYPVDEEESGTDTDNATVAAEIAALEADLIASAESYYSDLQKNILVPSVTYPLQQLFDTFSYSHSYQRKLMYSGLPLLFYQVQPHLESEVQSLRSQMAANDESTTEKRRELKRQNQRLKVVTQQQKEVQLLVDHIQQCIKLKKQSSMNMKHIPSLLRWVSIVRRYGGVDPYPTGDPQLSLTDAQKRRRRHQEARARRADGDDVGPSHTKADGSRSSNNDNTDGQHTLSAAVNSYSINLFGHSGLSDFLHWFVFRIFGIRIYEAIVIILIMVLPTAIDIAINTAYWAVQLHRFASHFCLPWLVKKIQKKSPTPNHRSVSRTTSNSQQGHLSVPCAGTSRAADIKGDNNWFSMFIISAMRFVISVVGVIVTLYAQFGYLLVPLVPLVFFLGIFENNFVEPLFDFVTSIKGRGMFSNYVPLSQRSPIRHPFDSTVEIWFTVWAVVTKVQKASIFVVLTVFWAFLAHFILRPMYRSSLTVEGVNARGGRRLGHS